MRQAADGFAPHQHFPPIRRRGEVGEGGIEVLGPALPGGGAGAAQAGRDGRQDTVSGHGGAGNKAHPQRRDGQGSGPGKVLLQISTQATGGVNCPTWIPMVITIPNWIKSYPSPPTTGTISGAAISIMETPSIKQPRKIKIRAHMTTIWIAEKLEAATISSI